MSLINLVVTGAKGRMGRAILAAAGQDPHLRVVGEVDLGDNLQAVIGPADVVVDFSFHTATVSIARTAAEHRKALVIGTTGHDPAEKAEVQQHRATIPIVWSANFSVGVNLLFALTRRAAEVLGSGYDQEIIEMHHRLKKDAPSGTALRLAEILADTQRQQLENLARHGRKGICGERTTAEIGIHAVRGGDIVGDHTVLFAGPGERIELTHRASSRDTFARGALRAAKWVVGRPPGLYDMQDVLGLR